MLIVTDDQKGIGSIKGTFVYIPIEDATPQEGVNWDIDCSVRVANAEEFGGGYLSEWKLIDLDNDNVVSNIGVANFQNSFINPLDVTSKHKVAILTKDEIGEMIKSLQKVYDVMLGD